MLAFGAMTDYSKVTDFKTQLQNTMIQDLAGLSNKLFKFESLATQIGNALESCKSINEKLGQVPKNVIAEMTQDDGILYKMLMSERTLQAK